MADLWQSVGFGGVGGVIVAVLDVLGIHKRINKLEDTKQDIEKCSSFQKVICDEMKAIRDDIKSLGMRMDSRIDRLDQRIDRIANGR